MPAKRILVIDDVSVIRGFVKGALKHLDVRVGEASGAEQALAMLESMPADVIICDLNMPGMSGEAFVKTLRERGDSTPIIMLTVEGDRKVIAKLLQAGIQGYLLKPFKPAVLAERVQELLDGTAPPVRPYEAPAEAAEAPAEDSDDTPAEAAADTEATDTKS
ncbi:response regulator transcription factor [Denitromonas ohlonensis]|uniref:Response regulator n=2 Tax=Denitromonas TaxID=139331 RepID=A0A558CQT6_9RHOO|nr:response regulator [Denitromonas ohlonensis]TVO68346.1 response regulator [Denitromonas ohlonensis]TVO74624.1 response regulator [Denitromonas ohlonensis]TVT51022.1 MAG: response regulator [Denitromonas halophila]TVT67243.1 MAG: response regulator [Denitromonas halophila]